MAPAQASLLAKLDTQERVRDFLTNAVASGRASHAYLFLGAPGAGKLDAAWALAQAFLCEQDGCGACDSCVRVARHTHPDVHYYTPESATGYLIAQTRELLDDVPLAPIRAKAKVYIIDRAEQLRATTANALLKTLEEPEKKGIAGLFRKAKINSEELKARFSTAEVNVDRISGELEKHKVTLLKDVAVMDQMYDRNLQYFKELTMYILAGKQKLAEARSTTLRELREKAETSNLPEDAQAANDFENKCVRFEKKLHDLELTRMISLQTAPQIRMIQNNDTALVEKIQTSVLNTIPLWKNQMVLTLGIENSRRAMEAQRQVTDMTNALLQKNADMLHMASVETAKESERGIVDMETLKHTNEQLISTLDEVLQIQTDGAKKRQEAEQELRRLEGELKQKLLQPRS